MTGLSGIDQLRAMIAGDAQPSIGRTLNFRLVEVGDGLAVFEGNPDERTYNPMGSVHGGYAATLLDSACGVASLRDGNPSALMAGMGRKLPLAKPGAEAALSGSGYGNEAGSPRFI